MKTLILVLVTTCTVLIGSAIAGPFRSFMVEGHGGLSEELVIPKGKAITVVNFHDSANADLAQLLVRLDVPGSPTFATVLIASSISDPNPAPKDLTINGPATLLVAAPVGHFAYLAYKLFAN